MTALGDWLNQRAAAHGDELHRELAQSSSGICHLVYDPALIPLGSDEDTVSWLLENQPARSINIAGAKLDREVLPLYRPLITSQSQGSGILASSLAVSLRELQVQSLQRGIGRRIGGWVQTTEPDAAFGHLGRSMLQRRPEGTLVWVRLHDPAVLWALWPLLSVRQQACLLGPLMAWWLHDPAGHLQVLRVQCASSEPLVLAPEQFPLVDGIHAVNSALRQRLAAHGDSAAVSSEQALHWRQSAFAAIRRARQHGLSDERDLSAFCNHALLTHPRFDEHPRIAGSLSRREAGQYFTQLVDDVSEDEWRLIAAEMSKLAGSRASGFPIHNRD